MHTKDCIAAIEADIAKRTTGIFAEYHRLDAEEERRSRLRPDN